MLYTRHVDAPVLEIYGEIALQEGIEFLWLWNIPVYM